MSVPKLTFYFDDVIPDYATWKLYVSKDIEKDDIIDNLFFTQLLSRYRKSQIAYTNQEFFIEELKICYRNVYGKYAGIYNTSKKIQALTDDELKFLRDIVSNISLRPTTQVTNVNEIFTYINEQRRNFATGSPLDRYLLFIANMPTYWLDEFAKDFEYLFLPYIPNSNAIFKKE